MRYSKYTGIIILSLAFVFVIGCGGGKGKVTVKPEPLISDESVAEEQAVAEPVPVIEPIVEPVETGEILSSLTEPVQLTFSEGDNGFGQVHADGQQIVFQSNRDGHWQVYVLDLADNSERRLMKSESNDENPIWAGDGDQILFVSDRDGTGEWERDIYRYILVTGEISRLTFSAADDWSPLLLDPEEESFLFLSERESDSSEPFYSKANALFKGFFNGDEPLLIAGPDIDPSSPVVIDDETYLYRASSGVLQTFSVDHGVSDPLTPSWIKCGSPTLDPLTGMIAFTGKDGAYFNLFLLDCDAEKIQQIAKINSDIIYPRFSLNGDFVIFTSEVDGHYQLFRQNMER